MVVLNAFLKSSRVADMVSEASILAGLVPNGLFVSIAIAMALAAVRILRYGALVQQLERRPRASATSTSWRRTRRAP